MFLQHALPSANVVWGKVIFSQACVILGVCVAGEMATEAGSTYS